jgi:hypothetical protein
MEEVIFPDDDISPKSSVAKKVPYFDHIQIDVLQCTLKDHCGLLSDGTIATIIRDLYAKVPEDRRVCVLYESLPPPPKYPRLSLRETLDEYK